MKAGAPSALSRGGCSPRRHSLLPLREPRAVKAGEAAEGKPLQLREIPQYDAVRKGEPKMLKNRRWLLPLPIPQVHFLVPLFVGAVLSL